jgi:hypothetical protein
LEGAYFLKVYNYPWACVLRVARALILLCYLHVRKENKSWRIEKFIKDAGVWLWLSRYARSWMSQILKESKKWFSSVNCII